KITDGTIASADILDETIVSADIDDGTIASTDIKDNTIAAEDLASDIAISTTGLLTIKTLATSGTGNGFCVGTATLTSHADGVSVENTAATVNSIIFLTPVGDNPLDEALKVADRAEGFFIVKAADDGIAADHTITFNYLIIN
ncbi:MAG: hypothetical protein ABIH69_02055, partial [bacterium]